MSEPSLRQRLDSVLRDALRSGNQDAKDTIRFTLAAIKNADIEKGKPLTDDELLIVLQQQAKRRADAIDRLKTGNRLDLVEREEAQLRVLEKCLPESMSDEELTALVSQTIGDVGATDPKDMGKVLPVAIERAAGRANGRRLSTAVREELAKLS
jgi:uncharacterized protein YqeY